MTYPSSRAQTSKWQRRHFKLGVAEAKANVIFIISWLLPLVKKPVLLGGHFLDILGFSGSRGRHGNIDREVL